MYKIMNVAGKPVFVEGVCLNPGECRTLESKTPELDYAVRKGLLMISKVENTESKPAILTEEGSEKRKRKSSKSLNE